MLGKFGDFHHRSSTTTCLSDPLFFIEKTGLTEEAEECVLMILVSGNNLLENKDNGEQLGHLTVPPTPPDLESITWSKPGWCWNVRPLNVDTCLEEGVRRKQLQPFLGEGFFAVAIHH